MSTLKIGSIHQNEVKTKNNKPVEQYMELLPYYQKLLDNEKTVVFMQVGDFFEIYGLVYPDGREVGNLWKIIDDLHLKIASKSQSVYGDKTIDVKMAGIPIHAQDKYINMAVEDFSWNVILIEQKGQDKNIIRYESAIITPGINSFCTQETNNLMVIFLEKVPSYTQPGISTLYAGIAYLDCLTGESGLIQYPYQGSVSDSIIYDEILKMITIKNPAEIIIYTQRLKMSQQEIINHLHLNYNNYKILQDQIPDEFNKKDYQTNLFKSVYENKLGPNMDIYQHLDLYEKPVCVTVLTMMLTYVIKRNNNILEQIQPPTFLYHLNNNLVCANNSLRQLNIINNNKREFYQERYTSLFDILNKTKTGMGKRLFKNRLMNPITVQKELQERYTFIGEMKDIISLEEKNEIRKYLSHIQDIPRILRLFARKKISLTHLPGLHDTLVHVEKLLNILVKIVNEKGDNIPIFKNKMISNKKITSLKKVLKSIVDTFYLESCSCSIYKLDTNIFKPGFSTECDTIEKDMDVDRNIMDLICDKLSEIIQDKLKGKKANEIHINKGFNAKLQHHIYTSKVKSEILRDELKKDKWKEFTIGKYQIKGKDIYMDMVAKGKVRIDLKCIHESSGKLIDNTNLLIEKMKSLFHEWIIDFYNKNNSLLTEVSDFIAEIDFVQSASKVALENGYCCPVISNGEGLSEGSREGPWSGEETQDSFIQAEEIRHPLIEAILQDVPYIPNDVDLGKKTNGLLLFGLNASGKSSYMKSVGINIIMAQAGLWVAAKTFTYYPFKYLFTRILSNDNIFAGLSTFAVEMTEFKTILKYANHQSIILGDELCSGTETLDATALVAAGIDNLAKRRCNFIFATHLHFLSNMKQIHDIKNVKKVHMYVAFDASKNKFIYDRKIKDGSGPSSYGISFCRALGLPEDYMKLSEEIRSQLGGHQDILLGKKSKYNTQKIITKCEVCGLKEAVDTHHIKFQNTADENGMIQHFHKNNKWNLVGLCKDCHQAVHSVPPRLKIDEYRQTSDGIQLDFVWLNTEKKSITQIAKELGNIPEARIESIITHYKNGLSVHQIQNKLRNSDNIKMTRNNIDKVIEWI